MTERIYLSPPDVGVAEEEAVVRAVRSGWVAPLGPEVDAFEQELATRIGVGNAVALSSGTAGLHLGLLVLGVKQGDYVITSTLTFVATANAISYTGAVPYFVDVEEHSGNMDPDLVEKAIKDLRAKGHRIGALITVDLLGKMADYERLEVLARKHDVPLLADSAESLGATRNGRHAGSTGAAAVVSFNGNKIMTTSGGGMLLTSSDSLATRVRYLATQARDAAPHYQHSVTGYNYRMSNVLAALGRAQLSRLDGMISRRRTLRERYHQLFAQIDGVTIFGGADDAEDNCWLSAILVNPREAGWTREDLSARLEEWDIESRPLWKPMHLQPLFEDAKGEITGVAQRLFERGLALPSGSSLREDEFERITEAIRSVVG